MNFMTLENWNPTYRQIWITLLVTLWIGATIANIATIYQMSVNFAGLAGISIFVAVLLVRSLRNHLPD
jgi:hypothetical protein